MHEQKKSPKEGVHDSSMVESSLTVATQLKDDCLINQALEASHEAGDSWNTISMVDVNEKDQANDNYVVEDLLIHINPTILVAYLVDPMEHVEYPLNPT